MKFRERNGPMIEDIYRKAVFEKEKPMSNLSLREAVKMIRDTELLDHEYFSDTFKALDDSVAVDQRLDDDSLVQKVIDKIYPYQAVNTVIIQRIAAAEAIKEYRKVVCGR